MKTNYLQVAGQKIAFVIKSSRQSKHIRILVHADGRLVVTKPIRVAEKTALRFLEEKSAWVATCLEKFKARPRPVVAIGGRSHFLEHRRHAAVFIKERVDFFRRFYDLQSGKISIRNQKTRWGSCSRDGNLSFNYRLAFLGPEEADYVIIHELCHLLEFNHSPAFWRLVSQASPDYRRLRRRLKSLNL